MIKPKFTLKNIPLSYISLIYTAIIIYLTQRMDFGILMSTVTILFYIIEKKFQPPKKINYLNIDEKEVKRIFKVK